MHTVLALVHENTMMNGVRNGGQSHEAAYVAFVALGRPHISNNLRGICCTSEQIEAFFVHAAMRDTEMVIRGIRCPDCHGFSAKAVEAYNFLGRPLIGSLAGSDDLSVLKVTRFLLLLEETDTTRVGNRLIGATA